MTVISTIMSSTSSANMLLEVFLVVAVFHTVTAQRNECTPDGWCYRSQLRLYDVPDDIPGDAVMLYLDNNNIAALHNNNFAKFPALTFLSLSWNLISDIEPGSFQGLISINEMTIFQNRLTQIKPGMFRGLETLDKLVLSNNQIHSVDSGAWEGLMNLKKLYLYANALTTLKANMFLGLDSLDELTLTFNKIFTIEDGSFFGLPRLEKLWMDNNNVLRDIRKDMFQGLDAMYRLSIHTNNISSVDGGVFSDMKNLQELDIDDNVITEIKPDTFHGLHKLTSVWLYNNLLTTLPASVFPNIPRPLDLTVGGNPLQCDRRLCWIKRGEREGWLRWIQFENRPLKPHCSSLIHWDSLQLDCLGEVECGDPGGVAHGVRHESHWPYTINTTISYSCQPCYQGGGTISCQSDGTWSRKPECSAITCKEPSDIQNGVKVPSTGPYTCGQHVTYICNHGYRLEGDASRLCQKNATFSRRLAVCVNDADGMALPSTAEESSGMDDKIKYMMVAVGCLALIIIVIVLVIVILRRRKSHRRRLGSNMEASDDGDGGAEGAMGGAVRDDGEGFVNKAAMLHDEAVSYMNLQGKEKEGLPPGEEEDYTPGAGAPSPGAGAGHSPGASPFNPPVYDDPAPPPEYTRHPSYMEIGEAEKY